MRRILLLAIVLIAISIPGGAVGTAGDQLRNRPTGEIACCNEWR